MLSTIMFDLQEKQGSSTFPHAIPKEKVWFDKPRIEVDYQGLRTSPFPNGHYLREKSIELLTRIADGQNTTGDGNPVELLGEDGYGKSTMTEEIERYNRDHGKKVLRIDVRQLFMTKVSPEHLGDLIEALGRPEEKTILILDSTDELWFKEKLRGQSLEQLRHKATRQDLHGDEARQLQKLELKDDYLDWLIANKSRLALVITAHSDQTPAARDYKDEGLRKKLDAGLKPYTTRMLYTPYSPEDAEILLQHLGIDDPDLIRVIIKAGDRMHLEMKALVCMRINGLRLPDHFKKVNTPPGPMSKVVEESYVHAFKYWLGIYEEENLKHMAP